MYPTDEELAQQIKKNIDDAVTRAMGQFPSLVSLYPQNQESGRQEIVRVLIAVVMKDLKGKANPGMVNDQVRERLDTLPKPPKASFIPQPM